MNAKQAKCRNEWEKYALVKAYAPSESSLGFEDFQAGFEAGYAAALASLELADRVLNNGYRGGQ